MKRSNRMQAVFAPPKPIRGGIPICFPQVGVKISIVFVKIKIVVVWAVKKNKTLFATVSQQWYDRATWICEDEILENRFGSPSSPYRCTLQLLHRLDSRRTRSLDMASQVRSLLFFFFQFNSIQFMFSFLLIFVCNQI